MQPTMICGPMISIGRALSMVSSSRAFAQMNDMGKTLDRLLNGDQRPRQTGFVLLMFEFGADKRMNYLSNAERADMLSALKDLVANFEGRAVDYHGRG